MSNSSPRLIGYIQLTTVVFLQLVGLKIAIIDFINF